MRLRRSARLFVHDIPRITRGVRDVLSNRWGEDCLDVSLALLRSAQKWARVGGENLYEARLLNPQLRDESLDLVLDVYGLRDDGGVSRHLGFAVMGVPLEGKLLRELQISFDWRSHCTLEVDGGPRSAVPLESFESPATPGLWRMTLVAREPETFAEWNRLEIVERLGADGVR
jgi:hypothetical protein